MQKNIFSMLSVVFVLMALTLSSLAPAAEYPAREISIVIGFAPGGTLDVSLRIILDELSRNLGRRAIIVNKPGGGGALAIEYAKDVAPDGYTILAAPIGFNVLPLINPQVKYKISDFAHLCKFATTPTVVIVRKDSPFKTIEDIITAARKNPGGLAACSSGVGSTGHLNIELINAVAGVKIVYIPVKSGGEINTQVLGGHVDFATNGISVALPLIKSGDLRPIVMTSPNRFPGLPGVPTLRESGYPLATLSVWSGVFVPARTPLAIREKITLAFKKTVQNPTIIKNYEKEGVMADFLAGKEFTQFLDAERKILQEIVTKAKIVQ